LRWSQMPAPQPPADVQAGEYEDGDDDQTGEHDDSFGDPGITGRRRRVFPGVLQTSAYAGIIRLAILF
jgi:hypothetical protein